MVHWSNYLYVSYRWGFTFLWWHQIENNDKVIFSNVVYNNQVQELLEQSFNIPLGITNRVSETQDDDVNNTNISTIKERISMCKKKIKELKMAFLDGENKGKR